MMRLQQFAMILVSFTLPATGRADDPSKPLDPWLGAIVLPKSPDVRLKDSDGTLVGDPLESRGVVRNVAGDKLLLERSPNVFGWVDRKDMIRVNEADAYFTEQIKIKPTAFAYRCRAQ